MTTQDEPRLRSIAVTVCENCIARKPGTCHAPGCLFIRFHIDDIPHLEFMFRYLDEPIVVDPTGENTDFWKGFVQ